MTKQDIINYVLETPGNTNPAILNQFLDEMSGDGGGGVNLHTVTLTINNSPNNVYLSFYGINENLGVLEYLGDVPLSDGNYLLPLYSSTEGGATEGNMGRENGERISMLTTGDINIEEYEDLETGLYNYQLDITGDCSITFE